MDRLKSIILGLNEECQTNIGKTGKKQDLIDRISMVLDMWRSAPGGSEKFTKARTVIYAVKRTGGCVSFSVLYPLLFLAPIWRVLSA